MEPKKPMLWTRVDQDVADEAQRLADERYDGNVSMFVRQAVKHFVRALQASPIEVSVSDDAARDLVEVAS